MAEPSLAWRVEEVCLNAFPSLRSIVYRDWLLRLSDGFTRRANSINPRAARIDRLEAGIDTCAALFAGQGQQPLFRVPSIADPALALRLERLGYGGEGETITLWADLQAVTAATDAAVEIAAHPTPEWLEAMGRLQKRTQTQNAVFARIMARLAVPAGFAALREDGALTALALGAVHDGLLCFESVVTDEARRGRGQGRRLLAALNAWGLRCGAGGACLQVEATNTAGRALYARLGMTTELYRYHYRRAPAGWMRNGVPAD